MLSNTMVLIIIIVVLAVIFDFINGFHDSANAIATSVSTRVLSMREAVLMSAFFNFLGAFMSTKVAQTIGNGLVDPKLISSKVIIAALIGAIVWDLLTWYFGLPSSSSHALIGGLLGAAIVYKTSFMIVNWPTFMTKVVLWLFLSPVLGFVFGYLFMKFLNFVLKPLRPTTVTKFFSKAQIVSAMLMALNHGGNDAQKSMGIITMALVSGGVLTTFKVPIWVTALCALAMAMGTSMGGQRIIKTMGMKMSRLVPVNGFAAETISAAIIFTATMLNSPVSTTHIISSAIMGVGAAKRISSVKWSLAKDIIWAWVITIPVSMVVSGIIMILLTKI